METKKSSNWIIKLISYGMLLYTGYRTVELMSLTLPPDNWWVGFFALFALDIGVLAWTHYYMHHAQSDEQERIAFFMIWLCVGGVALAMFGDTFYQTSKRDFMSVKSDFTFWAIVVQGIIIVSNLAAGIWVLISSPIAKLERQNRRIYFDIEEKKQAAIKGKADILAKEAAEIEANYWLEEERQKYRVKLMEHSKPLELPGKPTPAKKDIAQTAPIYFSADGGDNIEEEQEAGPDNGQSPFSSIRKLFKGQ